MPDFKQFRKDKKLTQSELGEIIGVSGNTISQIEMGRIPITHETRQKLTEKFGSEWLDFESKMTSPKKSADTPAEWFELFIQKDKQLTECMAENARLLREIIELKDSIAKEREMTKSSPKTTPKLS